MTIRLPPLAVPGFEQTPIEWTREYWNTRRLLRALWLVVTLGTLIALAVLVSLASSGRLRISAERQFVLFVCSTIFTCLTVPISIYGIHMHLVHFSKPHIQRHVIRVLWMVPIYGLNAWLALLLGLICANEKWILMPDTVRQCYEAYTIYSFYRFVYSYIEDREQRPIVDVLRPKPPMRHIFPLRMSLWTPSRGWFEVYSTQPWVMGSEFVSKCTYGVNNYVFVKPLTTLVTFICVLTDTYGDYQIRPDVAFPYITFVDNASQVWAMYCLILVYINCHDEIAGLKPAVKFLCVKGVVFATFWQNSLLSLLAFVGSLDGINWNRKCSHASSDSVVMSLQNFLISVEMLIFAVLHAYAFPSREYRDATVPPRRAAARLKALLDVSDVYDDVRGHAETVADQVVGGVRDVGGLVAGKMNHVADHVIRVGGRRKRRSGGSRDLLNEPLLEEEDIFDEGELDDDAAWLRIDTLPADQQRAGGGSRGMLEVDAQRGGGASASASTSAGVSRAGSSGSSVAAPAPAGQPQAKALGGGGAAGALQQQQQAGGLVSQSSLVAGSGGAAAGEGGGAAAASGGPGVGDSAAPLL